MEEKVKENLEEKEKELSDSEIEKELEELEKDEEFSN